MSYLILDWGQLLLYFSFFISQCEVFCPDLSISWFMVQLFDNMPYSVVNSIEVLSEVCIECLKVSDLMVEGIHELLRWECLHDFSSHVLVPIY